MSIKSFFYQVNLFLRSLIFTVVINIIIFFYSFICLILFFFPLRYRYAFIKSFLKFCLWFLKILCHIDYHIEGRENIPPDRAGVILSKHQSTWETFCLPLVFHEPVIIIKRELLWVPFFGWGLGTLEPIAINRSDHASAMEQIIKKGKKCLAEGRWILVFPEGTRILPGKIGHYRKGGAKLAVEASCPVIPVAHNAGRFWGKKRFIKQPGTIRMIIGPLIETEGKSTEEVLAETKNWIEKTMLEL